MTTNVNWMNGTNIAAYWLTHDRLSDAFYVVTGVCTAIFIVLAVFGNVLTILVFVRSHHLEFVSNWFLMNMSMADLLASTLCYPLVVIASFSGYWPFGHAGCYTYSMVVGTCNFATIGSMALVAIDRCLVIRRCTGNQPLRRGLIGSSLSRKMARMALILVWLYSICLVMPPVFGWGNYILDAMQVSCTFDYLSADPNAPYFVLTLFTGGFCVPLSTIVVCYMYIFSRLHKHQQTTLSFLRTHSRPTLSPRMSDFRMAKVGVTMVTIFVVAWLPYGILAMAGTFGRFQISPKLQVVAELFAKASATYNPIIYSMSHPNFRRKVRYIVGRFPILSLIACCIGSSRNVTRESSLNGKELEININVSVRRKNSQGDQSNGLVSGNVSVCDLEMKQVVTILKDVRDRPIFMEQVIIQHVQ